MLLDNVVMLLVAGVFSMLALLVDFYIVVEIIRLVREFFAQLSEGSRAWAAQAEGQRAVQAAVGFEGGRTITPFEDRDTVERLIDHFEEEEAETVSGQ